ncbi:MAG: beta-ketoacyl-ACP synthase III [Burkholderiales bacterium]
MIYSRIIGTGAYLPEKMLSNRDLEAMVNTSDQWIFTRTGIRNRHIASEQENTSDLAFKATQRATEAANIDYGDIDLIIVATSTPDMIFPSTACFLQAKLGIKGCAAFDVQAVCTGFIYGMAIADKFIRSGQHRCAVVIGAEIFSRILDWKDRGTCVLFGDGAGAVVLQASSTPGVCSSHLHADGSYANILSTPGSVRNGEVCGVPFLKMEGNSVFKLAVHVMEQVGREALAANQLSIEQVDWFIAHQANVRIINATARKLGLPLERVVLTVEQHGNTSAASVPLALDVAVRDGRIKSGHTVLLEGVGGGFTWGSILMKM